MSRAREADISDLMPEDEERWYQRFLRANARRLLGLALLGTLALTTVALATWRVDDPSFSNAVDRPAENLLGYPGAVVADLAMQFFGIAIPLLLLPALFWGWRLLRGVPARFSRLTIATWLGGALLGTAAAATLPISEAWPLPTGLGGVLGDLILRLPEAAFGAIEGFRAVVAGLIFALLAAALTAHATGWTPRGRSVDGDAIPDVRPEPRHRQPRRPRQQRVEEIDEDVDDDRSGIGTLLFGAAAHFGYRMRAGWARLRRRRDPFDEAFPAHPYRSSAPSHLTRGALPADDAAFAPDDFDGMPLEHEFEDGEEDVEPEVKPPPRQRRRRAAPARKRGAGFEMPPIELLTAPKPGRRNQGLSEDALDESAQLLESVLDDFGIRGEIVNIWPGPVVTLYDLEPAPGIKSSRVISLADDIARSMSAIACRVAVIPGKNAIGIELPNENRETVLLRELLASEDFDDTKARLPLCLGKNIGGEPVIADLSRMPHLLVAGTTGSGKSVSINTMILSLLYRLTPEACRLILIDPKMLELSVYDGIPHLLTPVVTDPKKAVVALKWTVREMEDRYRKMSKLGVRNIDGLNSRVAQAKQRGEVLTRSVHTGFDPDTGEPIMETEELDLEPMPYIVVIIDEMADLMMVAGKEIEGAVQRLAQMARAAGIHVVMATQRPSVDVITGTIKANFPTRISFQVTSKIDSRTILGEQGAEQLLGQGDMLYMMGGGRITRVHGPFVSDEEVEGVVAHLKAQGMPEYLEAITAEDESDPVAAFADPEDESNDLYDRAVAVVLRDRKASTSYIQRRLSIGYNRAASIIERMENEGVVGPANHAGKREILVDNGEEAY